MSVTYCQLDLAVLAAAGMDQTRHAVMTGTWHLGPFTVREYLRSCTVGGTHVTERFEAAVRDEWRKLENRRRKNEKIYPGGPRQVQTPGVPAADEIPAALAPAPTAGQDHAPYRWCCGVPAYALMARSKAADVAIKWRIP